MAEFRLGIIGCGGMGASHQQGLKEIEDKVKVTCTCDIIEERAKEAAENLGAEHYVTDYKDMLDYVDGVLVVLPHELHYEVGMFFIRRKKHVLMEKPMCVTEYQCKSLIEAAEEYGVTLMTAYPVRYWPAIRKLKELIDSGEYGDLFQMSIWTEQYTNNLENKGRADTIKNLGGGQLFSHGCHYIDILLWFMGRPVSGTHMGTNFGTPWMEREGTSNVIIQFENGAMGYHMGTWGARGTQHKYCFQLHTTKGMLEYSTSHNNVLLYRNLQSDVDSIEENNGIEVLWEGDKFSKQTQFEIGHFVDCVQTGKKPLTDGYGSLQGLRVIWKLYEAEENGKLADLRGLGLDQPD